VRPLDDLNHGGVANGERGGVGPSRLRDEEAERERGRTRGARESIAMDTVPRIRRAPERIIIRKGAAEISADPSAYVRSEDVLYRECESLGYRQTMLRGSPAGSRNLPPL